MFQTLHAHPTLLSGHACATSQIAGGLQDPPPTFLWKTWPRLRDEMTRATYDSDHK